MTNIDMILGNSNIQQVVMVAILNKKFLRWVFFDFAPGYEVGIHVTFLKVSASYIFQVEP